MNFYRARHFCWMIVIWFALLQAISPFIHGHLELDQPSQGAGLHVHADEFDVASVDQVPTIKNASNPMHIVVVDKAIVKNTQWLALPLCFMLLFFGFGVQSRLRDWLLTYVLFSPFLFLRSNARPRAPPHF